MRVLTLCALCWWPAVSLATAPACDVTRPASEVCDDFCNYRCGFYNTSIGDDGGLHNVTLYRLTPKNVTGIRNKDTGDANGDVTFYLSKKNLTQACARNPTTFGCFLDGDNIYGKFVVELSTQYGPYFECNPVNHGANPLKPDWVDTTNFMCGQTCLVPTPSGCHNFRPEPKTNGSDGGLGYECWCDGTARHNKTVGRELNPVSRTRSSGGWGPAWWPPQCSLSFEEVGHGTHCAVGKAYRQVKAWSFESAAALACDACSQDPQCEGWATRDNMTAELFTGEVRSSSGPCIGGRKHHDRFPGGGSWAYAGDVGGYWYSTPISAECAPGKAVGTDGCSWRVVSEVYKNASCIDGLVDRTVESHGQACFDTCAVPLNRTGDCYLLCYRNTLLGDAGFNITAMSDDQVVRPWRHGFVVDDPSAGGCPPVRPARCHGPQCGDYSQPLAAAAVLV